MITLKELKKMKPGIFARGEVVDSPLGANMTNSGRQLRWVAVRGGFEDWAIYCHWAENSWDWIKDNGDKIHNREVVKRLIPCDSKALDMYRD